jgi:hypothetical protein
MMQAAPSPKDDEKKMPTDYTDYTDFFVFFIICVNLCNLWAYFHSKITGILLSRVGRNRSNANEIARNP